MKLSDRSNGIKLTPIMQLVGILLYLRYHHPDCLLSFLFGIPRRSWCRYRKSIIKTLAENLQQFITLSTYQNRLREGTKVLGKPVTLIIDGFEKCVTKSTQKKWESITWSQKKKQNSFNTIIMVSPLTKRIRFMSKPQGGSKDDNSIVKDELENINKWLCDEDIIIGDEGFNGLEYLKIHTIPNRSSQSGVRKNFNEKRALVENAICDLRDWKFMQDRLKCFISDGTTFESQRNMYHESLIIIASINYMKVNEKNLSCM